MWRDTPHEAVFVEHSKQGRGGAILRTKLRNLENGAIVDNTFKGADKVDPAELNYRKGQYLYAEGDNYVFMDNDTFEQTELPSSIIGPSAKFMTEGLPIDLVLINGKVVNARIPVKVDLKVAYTEPGFKGDTQSTALKPATLETGAEIMVPLFIGNNEMIRVNTGTGSYVERVK